MLYASLVTIIHTSVCIIHPKLFPHTHTHTHTPYTHTHTLNTNTHTCPTRTPTHTITLSNSNQYTPHYTSLCNVKVSHPAFQLGNEMFCNSSNNFPDCNKNWIVTAKTTDIKICLQIEVYKSGRWETCSEFQGGPWLLLDYLQMLENCVGNCEVVWRAFYGGLHGGLYCLWQATEIELFYISFGVDNLNTCKLNEVNVIS